jgi:hypothetical protein
MKNRDKKQKKKRNFLKDYLKNKLKDWNPTPGKKPVSNYKLAA